MSPCVVKILSFFFFNDTATTEIYTLSLHDALPISHQPEGGGVRFTLPLGGAGRGLAEADRPGDDQEPGARGQVLHPETTRGVDDTRPDEVGRPSLPERFLVSLSRQANRPRRRTVGGRRVSRTCPDLLEPRRQCGRVGPECHHGAAEWLRDPARLLAFLPRVARDGPDRSRGAGVAMRVDPHVGVGRCRDARKDEHDSERARNHGVASAAGRVRQRLCIHSHCSGTCLTAVSIAAVQRMVSSTTARSASFTAGGTSGGGTMTRGGRPSRRMKSGATGVPVRTASTARLFDVDAARPTNGTNTLSGRAAFWSSRIATMRPP